MAIRSGFHRSIGEDRVYDAKFFADYFASFIGNGVFPNPSTNLQVMAFANMTTVVKPGKGWINGWILFNDADFQLVHDAADGVLKRIDRIVLRLDHSTRTITINIKKGTNANNPVAPTLTRGIDVYELALADVLINNGITTIMQSNITDTRSNTALCGYVAGVVQQLDTTTIYNQMLAALQEREEEYDTEFLQWSTDKQQEFDDWFASIQNILNENVAANLQQQITELSDYVSDSGAYLMGELDAHKDINNNNAHAISNITGLQSTLDGKATIIDFPVATINNTSWVANAGGGLKNEVTVTGILSTDKPTIGVSYTGAEIIDRPFKEAWSNVYRAETSTDKITFYALDGAPNAPINVNIQVVR